MLWIRIYIFESGSSCFLNGNADPDQGAFSMRIRIRREIECGSGSTALDVGLVTMSLVYPYLRVYVDDLAGLVEGGGGGRVLL